MAEFEISDAEFGTLEGKVVVVTGMFLKVP